MSVPLKAANTFAVVHAYLSEEAVIGRLVEVDNVGLQLPVRRVALTPSMRETAATLIIRPPLSLTGSGNPAAPAQSAPSSQKTDQVANDHVDG